jgi:hypothetical protein
MVFLEKRETGNFSRKALPRIIIAFSPIYQVMGKTAKPYRREG